LIDTNDTIISLPGCAVYLSLASAEKGTLHWLCGSCVAQFFLVGALHMQFRGINH
jgi:hypothetical protein